MYFKNIFSTILKSLIILALWLALSSAIYSLVTLFLLKIAFPPSQYENKIKPKQPSTFQGLFEVTDQIAATQILKFFP